MKTIDELEAFMLKNGEGIVDMVGGEIDRMELKLKVLQILLFHLQHFVLVAFTILFSRYLQKKHPQIRHCDLEIL